MTQRVGSDLVALLAQPIAHRGLHACGAAGPVENSISAARAAIAAGYGIECDVQLARDGEAIVFHDSMLERLTGVNGRIEDQDTASLRRLRLRDGPEGIPSLPELLAAIDGAVPLVIEIKSQGESDMRLADRTMALLDGYDGVVAIESFDPAVVLHCSSRVPRPVGLVGPPEGGGHADDAAIAASDFVSWSIDALDIVARTHPGLPRTTWTIRTSAQESRARRHAAQIVFEGFTPLRSVKPEAEQ